MYGAPKIVNIQFVRTRNITARPTTWYCTSIDAENVEDTVIAERILCCPYSLKYRI